MATKIIKAWIDGAIQNIEVEDIELPEFPLTVEERVDTLESKHEVVITDGNLLVGNGTEDLEEMTPEEVLSHINGASIATMTTEEYEALEDSDSNANTLYLLTDSEDTLLVTIDESDNVSHTTSEIIAHITNGGVAYLCYAGLYSPISIDTQGQNVVAHFVNADGGIIAYGIDSDGTVNYQLYEYADKSINGDVQIMQQDIQTMQQDIDNTVRWDVTQALTSEQKARARNNIGAISSKVTEPLYLATNVAMQESLDSVFLETELTSDNDDILVDTLILRGDVDGTIDTETVILRGLHCGVEDIDAVNKGQLDAAIASMVDSAPETLNTLNELAAALGNDENFATTVATQIGNLETKVGDTSVADQITDAVANADTVRYDTVQSLDDDQKKQARKNIGAIGKGESINTNGNNIILGGGAVQNVSKITFTNSDASESGAQIVFDGAESISLRNIYGENPIQIKNVKAGEADNDAVNVAQLNAAVASVDNLENNAVLYTEQTLTRDQQAQACVNIGAYNIGTDLDMQEADLSGVGNLGAFTGSFRDYITVSGVTIEPDESSLIFKADSAGTSIVLGNVANGTNPTDAVNKAQLDAAIPPAGTSTAAYRTLVADSNGNLMWVEMKNAEDMIL